MAAVHLINPLWDIYGGADKEALRLFEELDPITEVTLWPPAEPDPRILGKYPVKRIIKGTSSFPRGGNLIFCGIYFGIHGWVTAANAARIILIVNTENPDHFHEILDGFARIGRRDVEIVYICDAIRKVCNGPPGVIHPSPIDRTLFHRKNRPPRPFTIGRVSRDIPEKHHPEDVALYQKLADEGVRIRILGGSYLATQLSHPNIELLPAGAEEVPDFLATLDVFYFRPAPEWFECFGRVVAEAMLTGLPVVVGDRGGYLEYVDEGVTGFAISNADVAYDRLTHLRDDIGLRHRMGTSAAESLEELLSDAARQEALEYYTR